MWTTCIQPIPPRPRHSPPSGNHIWNAQQNSWNCEGITRTNRCSHTHTCTKPSTHVFPKWNPHSHAIIRSGDNWFMAAPPASAIFQPVLWLALRIMWFTGSILQEHVSISQEEPQWGHCLFFPKMTLCSVYTLVCLFRHKNDLCQWFCFEMQAFLKSLLASSKVAHFWTSSLCFACKNNGVMETELRVTSSWCSYFTWMFTFLSERIAECHTKAGEKWQLWSASLQSSQWPD